MPPKAPSATRESPLSISISQFVYRAVSFGDTTIEESSRFKRDYQIQQSYLGAVDRPDLQDYKAWGVCLTAFQEYQRGTETEPGPGETDQ